MSRTLNFPTGVDTGTVHLRANVLVRLARTVSGLRTSWKKWRAYRNGLAHLNAMDERMLSDIGLTRSEIGSAVRFGRPNDRGSAAFLASRKAHAA